MEHQNDNSTEQLKGALSSLIDAYQELLEQNKKLKDTAQTYESKIETLEAKVETLENAKFNIECELETAQQTITTLNSTKQEQNNEIYSMLGKIENLLGGNAKPSIETKEPEVAPKPQASTILEFEADSQKLEEQSLTSLTDFIEEEMVEEEPMKPEEQKEEEGYFAVGNRGGIDLDRMQSLLGGFGKK